MLSSSESKEMQCLKYYNPGIINGFIGGSGGGGSGGLFLEPSVPASFLSFVYENKNKKSCSASSSCLISVLCGKRRRRRGINDGGCGEVVGFWSGGNGGGGRFFWVTLSTVKVGEGEGIGEILGESGGEKSVVGEAVAIQEVEIENSTEKIKVDGEKGKKALNTVKHLWAGAVAAMVSRFTLFSY